MVDINTIQNCENPVKRIHIGHQFLHDQIGLVVQSNLLENLLWMPGDLGLVDRESLTDGKKKVE